MAWILHFLLLAGYLIRCYGEMATTDAVSTPAPATQTEGTDVLTYVTYACYALSITALTVSLIMFMTFRSWSTERYITHDNFVFAQICTQILFLVGVNQTENETICKVLAISLHFMFLSMFFWLLVEAIDLYFKVVLAFDTQKSKLPFYMFLGWGAPAATVIICAGNNSDQYGSQISCWVGAGNSLVWAYIGPAAAVVLINTILLVSIARAFFCTQEVDRSVILREEDDGNNDADGATLKGIFALTYLIMVTWVYGFLLIDSSSPFFQYGFVFSNALQGVFFFLLFCFFNKEVRVSWQRVEVKQPLPKIKLSSVIPAAEQPPLEAIKEDPVEEVKPVEAPKTVEEKKVEAKQAMWKAFDAMILDPEPSDTLSVASVEDDEIEEITEEKKEAKKALWGKFDSLLDEDDDDTNDTQQLTHGPVSATSTRSQQHAHGAVSATSTRSSVLSDKSQGT